MGLPAFQTVDFALDSEIVDSLLQMFVNIVVIRVTSPDLLLGAMWCFQQPIRHNLLHLWETPCRELWVIWHTSLSAQGLVSWYPMALSSGVRYLMATFSNICACLSSWWLLTASLCEPVFWLAFTCFLSRDVYTLGFHLPLSAHPGRMAKTPFGAVAPAPPP